MLSDELVVTTEHLKSKDMEESMSMHHQDIAAPRTCLTCSQSTETLWWDVAHRATAQANMRGDFSDCNVSFFFVAKRSANPVVPSRLTIAGVSYSWVLPIALKKSLTPNITSHIALQARKETGDRSKRLTPNTIKRQEDWRKGRRTLPGVVCGTEQHKLEGPTANAASTSILPPRERWGMHAFCEKKIAGCIHTYLLNYFILCKLKGNLHT